MCLRDFQQTLGCQKQGRYRGWFSFFFCKKSFQGFVKYWQKMCFLIWKVITTDQNWLIKIGRIGRLDSYQWHSWSTKYLVIMQIICQIWGETGILQIFDLIWSKVQTVDGWQIIQENDWEARSTAVHLVGDAQVANLEAWNENSQEFAHKK